MAWTSYEIEQGKISDIIGWIEFGATMTTLTTSPLFSSSFLKPTLPKTNAQNQLYSRNHSNRSSSKRLIFKVEAAKLPAGVEVPRAEPKFNAPFLGFTKTAEIWNSRACMIGLIGTFIVELILNKGILQLIGVEIGKGLDIPL